MSEEQLSGNSNEQAGTGGKLQLIAIKSFKPYDEMYKVVDFLNRSLRDRNLLFGLSKDAESGQMIITIYET